ncbi:hypothetical protein C6A86_010185 [Mycobacterium sp. ITM-2016-00316]|uniref:hypothetical protein n=1 Tax=Mycobacterium sp. ITM-2016-00316 TaxID=2099695 RepID=UPI000CF8542F|nr:hypothetical protein [Mycobacterium sp. ITM-2016-00316]WNG83974.1 hypothetical protein C6A86_010185 [Mycobacterium sp. ITM-2016-00316]
MEPMHPSDRHYRSTSIRLPELAVVSDVLHNLTFENCAIHGPAVIFLQGTSLTQCTFDGTEESLFWDLGERQKIVGAIALVGCTIIGCRFEGIGLAVTPSSREIYRKGLNL